MQTVMNIRARRFAVLVLCTVLLLVMSGCMYPKQHTPGQAVNAGGSVQAMQDAVKRYQDATGLLPIKNADASVPIYEKYKIDLAKLQRMGYIESIPKLAFESGGPYIFLIIDEETAPKVRLLDAAAFQVITDIQRKIDAYMRDKDGEVPMEGEAYPGFGFVDFGKLGIKRPEINSMFSPRPLELMVDSQGNVYADYGIDIAEEIRRQALEPSGTEDLRRILIENTPFVPVKSPEYRQVQDSLHAVPSNPG